MGPAAESRERDQRPRDLDVDQDLRFLRRMWLAQRVGWVAMLVVVVVALAGALGRGALADTTVTAHGLTARYDRIARYEARTTIEVHVPADAQPGEVGGTEVDHDTRTLAIDAELLNRVRVESITPAPDRVIVDGGRVLHEIDVGDGGGTIHVDVRPEEYGVHDARIGILGAGDVRVRMWVLP